MKTLLSFIKQRWFISLLGVLASGLFIWFLGPLFAVPDFEPLVPETHRLSLIGAIIVLWLIIRVWSFYKAKNQNNQVLAALPVLSVDEQATQDELQMLKERLQEALGVLKKTFSGGFSGQQFLYQLPWYIIIGPPGAGKTTLLKNSDLKFPLSDRFGKAAIRGVGGTRNCDWWFAEEAALLDTAGRYTTQDSNKKVDQAAWRGFLDLLKKYRSRRPINGVIIAVSLSDLLEQNKAEQQSQAISIRKRIQELYKHFNIRFPVYVLFTKCDLLAGFMEFFDELDRDKRAQVWGMTFTLEENSTINAVAQFPAEFDLLEQQLQNQLITKLERERSRERRSLIYTFPQQFSSLNNVIQGFLDEVFQTNRFERHALLRGVYFTSATQEGSPIDRIMGSLANSFGLDRQNIATSASHGKSFFINRLLHDVVFAESGLAGANLKLEHKYARLQWNTITVTGAVILLMAAAWLTSFVKNKAYINEIAEQTTSMQQQVNELDPYQNNPLPVLPILDVARHMPGGYLEQQEGTPWALDFGLYQGDKLGTYAASLYRKLLKELLLNRLMLRMEQQLQNNRSNTDHLYEGLKVYLMLADPDHYDKDAIRNWVMLDWKDNLPLNISNEQRQALDDHLNALLEVRPVPLPRPLNTALINQIRDSLENTPVAERVYARLMLELHNHDLPDFRVSDKAGHDASLVLSSKSGKPLTTGVSGLFTCSGYRDVFLKNNERLINQQTSDNWILGTKQEKSLTERELSMLHENVLKHYLEDYIQQWEALLNDIQIKPFSSQTQLLEVLNIIAGENSPLGLFLEAADQETSMNCLTQNDKTGEKLTTATETHEKIIRTTPEAQISVRPEITTQLVTNHFKELHQLLQANGGAPPALERSLSLLKKLSVYLNTLLHAPDQLVLEQRKRTIQVIIDQVKLESKRTPFPVNRLLNNISEGSQNLFSGGITNH